MAADLFGGRFRSRVSRTLRLDGIDRPARSDRKREGRLRLPDARPRDRVSRPRARSRGNLSAARGRGALDARRGKLRRAAAGRDDRAFLMDATRDEDSRGSFAGALCLARRRPGGQIRDRWERTRCAPSLTTFLVNLCYCSTISRGPWSMTASESAAELIESV